MKLIGNYLQFLMIVVDLDNFNAKKLNLTLRSTGITFSEY
jgi:hypothetical protein